MSCFPTIEWTDKWSKRPNIRWGNVLYGAIISLCPFAMWRIDILQRTRPCQAYTLVHDVRQLASGALCSVASVPKQEMAQPPSNRIGKSSRPTRRLAHLAACRSEKLELNVTTASVIAIFAVCTSPWCHQRSRVSMMILIGKMHVHDQAKQ
jgi:hypothetical protein